MPLPYFRYHPKPITTGAVEESKETCECCEEARGYVYASTVYAEKDVENVCPWCIADGSLNAKFGGTLSDEQPLVSAGLQPEIIAEVTERTPGYVCWQSEQWLACCDDACAFLGDAPKEDLQALDSEGVRELSSTSGFTIEDLDDIIPAYEPGGSPAFYKFQCIHCGRYHYSGDCD